MTWINFGYNWIVLEDYRQIYIDEMNGVYVGVGIRRDNEEEEILTEDWKSKENLTAFIHAKIDSRKL